MSAAPMLYAAEGGGARVAIAGKDGFVHGVDRTTRRLLFKTPVTTILNADKAPTPEGILACPGALGGVEWNGPALDPATHTIHVGVVDWCAVFTMEVTTHQPGDLYMGTAQVPAGPDSARGWVVALDGEGGDVRWKFKTPSPVVAGVTATAGGLLFTGDLAGNFYSFDKSTGNVLYTTNTGGAIAGGVITYAVGGRQYVATTSGNISRMTFKTTGSPRLVVMAVDGARGSVTRVSLPQLPPHRVDGPAVAAGSPAARGQEVYGQFCSACHGQRAEGGTAPSLVSKTARRELEAIIAFVKNPAPPIPKLYPSPIPEADVRAVAEYVRVLQQPGSP